MGKRSVTHRLVLATAVLCAGCSKSNVFDFYQLPAIDGELAYVGACTGSGSETLSLPLSASKSASRNANVVFVIDTSGSMSNEIDQVRANLDTFVSSIKSTLPATSTRFAVIGEAQSSKPVLPDEYTRNGTHNGVFWHFFEIKSTDKMQKIMRSYGMTTFQSAGDTINVGTTFPAIPGISFNGGCTNAGTLFNCNALNHIIIVTDDIERLPDVSGQDATREAFLGSFGAHLARNKNGFRLHAIHAKQNPSCNIAQYGKIYEDIAAATGSLSLDVCSANWSLLFNALRDNIVASSRAVGFGSCASAIRQVVSVRVKWAGGEVALAPADFVYANGASQGIQASIYVAPSTLQAKGVPIDGTPLTLLIESTY